ncbi:phospholipase D-like domain-containing protein [Haloarcula sp. CGMCC 1.2071]|uniref:phospholipase D-like domain-containing protein n=1 Tax=Haloarcula sp. CGMCC 1.2071 TaxID=3111454 RepID=UPI00300EA19C
MTDELTTADRALAIAEIVGHEQAVLDEVEGHLLVAAGRSVSITPAAVGRDTPLSRDAAGDLFRQLNQAGAIHRESHTTPIVESRYTVDAESLRGALDAARDAIQVVAAYHERHPETEATPLVTFPTDPTFDQTTPSAFGMDALMSTLTSEIKRSSEHIRLLSPFFEEDGFDRLAGVLLDALERGVELTIVTRYLRDSDSYNYAVISKFAQRARECGVGANLRTVDYTVWDEDLPASERRQDGSIPEFTLHAKIMTFDERAVYVGSANVTDYGFGRYLELGVLLGQTETVQFISLCDFLLNSEAAEEITL